MADKRNATIMQVKAYFGSDGYPPVANKELISFKKVDPDGYAEVARLVKIELNEQKAE